jgi:hypothetical protein
VKVIDAEIFIRLVTEKALEHRRVADLTTNRLTAAAEIYQALALIEIAEIIRASMQEMPIYSDGPLL